MSVIDKIDMFVKENGITVQNLMDYLWLKFDCFCRTKEEEFNLQDDVIR